jgi:hypothetical protein
MLGTAGATWLMCLSLMFIGLVGLLVGLLICIAGRRRWTTRIALTDAAVSVIAAAVSGYIIYSAEASRGIWESHNGLIIAIALITVILTHGFRYVVPRRKNP